MDPLLVAASMTFPASALGPMIVLTHVVSKAASILGLFRNPNLAHEFINI